MYKSWVARVGILMILATVLLSLINTQRVFRLRDSLFLETDLEPSEPALIAEIREPTLQVRSNFLKKSAIYKDLDFELTHLESTMGENEKDPDKVQEVIQRWQELRRNNPESMVGDYAQRRIEDNKRKLKDLALFRLEVLRQIFINETFRKFDWPKSRNLIRQYQQSFPNHFVDRIRALSDEVSDLEQRFGQRVLFQNIHMNSDGEFARVATTGPAAFFALNDCDVAPFAGFRRRGAIILGAPNKSQLQIVFYFDKIPENLICGLVLCCAQIDIGSEAYCDIRLNGKLLAGRWTPRAHHWTHYTWSINDHAKLGQNILSIDLHSRARRQLWFREAFMLGSERS